MRGCRHHSLIATEPAGWAWPDGTPLSPSPQLVECACGKQWLVGFSRAQQDRLARTRVRGDKRSVFEIGPEILREVP